VFPASSARWSLWNQLLDQPQEFLSGRCLFVVLVLSPCFAQQSEERLPDPAILFFMASKQQGSRRRGGSRCESWLSACTGRGGASKPGSPPWGVALTPQ